MAERSPTAAILDTLNVTSWPPPDRARAPVAAALALDAYSGHTRDQGTDYIAHPLAVVTILRSELHVTAPNTLLLGLLHDALEVSPDLAPQIKRDLGNCFVEQLVAMTPDHRLQQRSKRPEDEPAWRAKNANLSPEGLLTRLADRVHNLRDLRHSPDRRRRERFISALVEFYLPLARATRSRSSHLDLACTVLEAEFESYTQHIREERE